jgi:hypothetical protein
MQDNLSYGQFLSWIENYNALSDNEIYKFEYIVRQIKEVISESEVEIFYPQNLLLANKETDLLLFTKNKIFKVTGNVDKAFFEVFDINDVVNYNFEVSRESGNENVILNIYFTLDRHLVLNSQDDTNNSYRYTFVNKTKEIYKKLLNK